MFKSLEGRIAKGRIYVSHFESKKGKVKENLVAGERKG